jgi:hypothetical protein
LTIIPCEYGPIACGAFFVSTFLIVPVLLPIPSYSYLANLK